MLVRYIRTPEGSLILWRRSKTSDNFQMFDGAGRFNGALEAIEEAVEVDSSMFAGDRALTKEEAIMHVLERRATRAMST